MSEESIVEDWLRSLHLSQYTQSFLDNGYDDLEICKQIGDPDLDAIGVTNQSHRQQILLAVRVLLEQGGTAVYFTLEEYRHAAQEGYKIENEDFCCSGDRRGKEDHQRQYADEYEEGKAELVRFPKLQLKILIRDKLERDGIRLSAPPYSNLEGSRGHLETLAVRYAQELRTHQQDVLERLQELRRRAMAASLVPATVLQADFTTSMKQQQVEEHYGSFRPPPETSAHPEGLKPGKYSPSSCLSDDDNVYGLYQPVAPHQNTCEQQTSKEGCTSPPQRFLSPRSRYFYEPCPFPSAAEFRENGEQLAVSGVEGVQRLGPTGKCKRGGGLGKLFRTLGSKKGLSPKHKSVKAHHHSFTLRLHDRCKSSSQGTVQISEPLLGDEERYHLMRMLRDGSLTVQDAMHRIGGKQMDRYKDNRIPDTYTLSDLTSRGQAWESARKGPHKPSSVFYLDSLCYSAYGPENCESPEESLDDPVPVDPTRTLPSRFRANNGPSRRAFTQEEFTTAILARTKVKLGQKLATSESTTLSSEPCRGECGNIMCSLSSTPASLDLSPPPAPPDGDAGENEAWQPATETGEAVSRSGASPGPSPLLDGGGDNGCQGEHCSPARRSDHQGQVAAMDSEHQTQHGPLSPALERRSHHGSRSGVFGKIRSLTNRSSYSTSEEGHSSDCEDAEDARSDEPCPQAAQREGRSRSGSSFAGKVRDLHRDVKRRISKLRSGHARTVSDSESRDQTESPGVGGPDIHTGSSVESLPSGSGDSRTSLQGHTPTSSNRSSSSAGEEDAACNSIIGPILGRARAIVDVTPSPYDRDALGFKKGDLIDIIAKNKTGTWVGALNGKVGHFKFINVQEISESSRDSRPRRRRGTAGPHPSGEGGSCPNRSSPSADGSALTRPQSLEQLLEQNGLQDCVNVLMLHGYEDLEAFKEISKEDLTSLGITDPSVQGILLRAADLLVDDEAEEYPEDWTESPPNPNSRITFEEDLSGDDLDSPYQASINDLDAQAHRDSHAMHNNSNNNNSHQLQASHHSDSQENRVCVSDEFQPNIPASQVDLDGFTDPADSSESTISLLRTTAQILKQSGYDSEGSSISYPVWREDYHLHENGHAQKVPPPIPKRTTPPITRPSKFVNGLGVNGGCGIYFAPEDLVQESSRSATMPRKKLQEGQQEPQAPSRGNEKKLYKKFTQRKNSLQTSVPNNKFPRPPSHSLLTAVCRKLEDEGIDLGQDPYTDKTGFCGIPPALVQRYAEELQRDVYDVAEAMDQARINSLQIRGRRGVPNDFLADSCNGPVVEANYRGLREWLVSLGLPMYEEDLSVAGFESLARVATMRDTDLCAVGIRNARHVRLLTTAIGALNIHFGRLMCP